MRLENLENKEPLIKNFFNWVFDDNRFINKELLLDSELDLTLAPYYMDANIYYPKQIADFFNTKAMQRLGRISQLNLVIDEYPNTYHNRLEHSKGVYNRKLEEMLYNFQNPTWKKHIENNNLKIYLLAELIKIAGHDIGHLPLSHALEVQIFSCRGAHELIGKRIMLEDVEIQSILSNISPDLPMAIKDLYEKPMLNFREHDESNYDVDRLDYISRDFFYVGKPLFLPFVAYESIPVLMTNSGFPKVDSDGSILVDDNSDFTIDVYEHSSLSDIEELLENRENGYKNIYLSTKTHIRENTTLALFKSFLSINSHCGQNLNNFVTSLKTSNIHDIDLSLFLEWDDIKFYSQILDIAENHENPHIRDLAIMSLPNMNSFLTMLYSQLELYNKQQVYSNNDKKFLKNIKRLIKADCDTSKKLKNQSFALENTLVFPNDKNLLSHYSDLIKDGIIQSSKLKIKAYNPNNPIFVKGSNGKIYELSQHPDRKCDWNNRTTYLDNVFAYIPFLRLNGLSDNEIEKMRGLCNSIPTSPPSKKISNTVNMQPLQVGNNIEDCFLEL